MLSFENDGLPPSSGDMMGEVLKVAIEHTKADIMPTTAGAGESRAEQYRARAKVLRDPRVPCLQEVNEIAAAVLLGKRLTRKQLLERLPMRQNYFTAALGYLRSNELVESVRTQEGSVRRYYFQATDALDWAAQQPDYPELRRALEARAEN